MPNGPTGGVSADEVRFGPGGDRRVGCVVGTVTDFAFRSKIGNAGIGDSGFTDAVHVGALNAPGRKATDGRFRSIAEGCVLLELRGAGIDGGPQRGVMGSTCSIRVTSNARSRSTVRTIEAGIDTSDRPLDHRCTRGAFRRRCGEVQVLISPEIVAVVRCLLQLV